jgi:F0F1-type ATP synthase assembly protein I
MKTSLWRVFAALSIAAAGVAILVMIAKSDNAGQRDFISYWSAGQQLVHGGDPYDAAAIQRLERTAGYDQDYRLIMRNPPIAFFMALPLGLVSANTGIVLWQLALLASLVLSIRMLWNLHGCPDNRLHLLGYCFAPVMECLMAGQLGIFLLLGVVLFLYCHKSRPLVGGAALLLCAVKPHLFVPLGLILLIWVVWNRAFRILAGFSVALLASCTLAFCVDRHAWSQYLHMMSSSGIMGEIVPTSSEFFRILVHRDAVWLQFVPQTASCIWAVWFFWTRRKVWSWMNAGLLLLLVSVVCAPYALLTDEAIVLPAVLAGIYRAEEAGRSILPFGLFAGVAMVEVFAKIPMASAYYLWTAPAWLAWFLYATKKKRELNTVPAVN